MIQTQRGFTLLELLIVIAILAIVTTMGTNGLQWLSERTQASATHSNIGHIFALARYTAVTKQSIVTICPLDKNNICVSDWALPTAVFLDPDSKLALTADNQLIRAMVLAKAGYITPSNTSSGPRRYFQYRPDGWVRGTIGNLTWCPQSRNPEMAIHVRVNFGGRLTWSKDNNHNNIVEGADGTDISC
ncbi:MAG TPA: GspH/FimT family pseudopilin [Marinobacter sp.]|nr:GspH/FimT family pseudopilin [Marinobacter sp.]